MGVQKPVQTRAADCPDCGEKVPVPLPAEIGQRVVCPHCMADLEVVETVPVELDWYYEEPPEDDDEDW
jgi:lysine biosynthesis protein LysW